MVRISPIVRNRAIALRKAGKTYGDIFDEIGKVSKSTLNYWLRDVKLSRAMEERLRERVNQKLLITQRLGQAVLKKRREEYFIQLKQNMTPLLAHVQRRDIALIVLAILYLAEGAKTRKGSLSFGNADPGVIALFLRLLRSCYEVDETKFRVTILGRADQNFEKLERFWCRITEIPRTQFYGFRVDPRSRGKKTMKLDYRGVCRIDYFSARVFDELMMIGELFKTGR